VSGGGGLIVALLLGFALTLANPGVADAGGFKGRKVLLTVGTVDGSGPTTACPEKFHFAHISEILGVSTLSYALELGPTIVAITDDMGSGLPAGLRGWVRTGGSSSTDATSGEGNCNN